MKKEAYQAYMENQKKLLSGKFGANFGPLGGLQLGPLGFKLGGGLGLQQTGLGAGVQLGPLGLGASTGLGNGQFGFNGNAGLGNNFLGHANTYTPAVYANQYYKPVKSLVPVHSNRFLPHIGAGFGVRPYYRPPIFAIKQ